MSRFLRISAGIVAASSKTSLLRTFATASAGTVVQVSFINKKGSLHVRVFLYSNWYMN